MIDRSIVELIHRDVDGVISPEESARLQRILASDAEARKLADDLRALVRGFAAMAPQEPPATLKPAILRSLASREARTRLSAGLETWRGMFTLRPILTFAGGAVAGILLFAAISGIVGQPGTHEQDLVGTMVPVESNEVFTPGEKRSFIVAGVKGTIETRYSGKFFLVRVRLDSPTAVVAVLWGGSPEVQPAAAESKGFPRPDLQLRGSQLILGPTSTGGCDALWTGIPDAGVTLQMDIVKNGEVLGTQEVELHRK
jgi:hypothetical protein